MFFVNVCQAGHHTWKLGIFEVHLDPTDRTPIPGLKILRQIEGRPTGWSPRRFDALKAMKIRLQNDGTPWKTLETHATFMKNINILKPA
jgi:hypothetical protein